MALANKTPVADYHRPWKEAAGEIRPPLPGGVLPRRS